MKVRSISHIIILEIEGTIKKLSNVERIGQREWDRLIRSMEEVYRTRRSEVRNRLEVGATYPSITPTDVSDLPLWCIDGLRARNQRRKLSLIKRWNKEIRENPHCL